MIFRNNSIYKELYTNHILTYKRGKVNQNKRYSIQNLGNRNNFRGLIETKIGMDLDEVSNDKQNSNSLESNKKLERTAEVTNGEADYKLLASDHSNSRARYFKVW